MPALLVGVASAVLVLGGVWCLYEYSLYDSADRRREPLRLRLFLAASVLATLVGAVGLVAAVTVPAWRWTVLTLVPIVGALPALAQYLAHRALGREHGPLTERLAAR